MNKNLTQGAVFSKLLFFALPILGANLLQAMYGTVDLLIIGIFSDATQVSAVSTGSMTLQTITGMITGLTMGTTVLIGQLIGEKNEKSAAQSVGASFWLFLIVGILLTFLIVPASPFIAEIMQAPAEAFEATAGYIRICGAGILFIVFFNAISGMFRGLGDSRTPLVLMCVACAGNIVGDLILIAGFGLHAEGAALATVGAQALSVAAAAVILRKKGLGFPVQLADLKPHVDKMKKILAYGLPIAAQELLTGISFMVMLAILNAFGLVASAGVGIAQRLCAMMFIVPAALLAAISAFTAQNAGAKNMKRADKGLFCGMGICCVAGLFMFLTGFFGGEFLAGLFSSEQDVILAAADYLKSYSVDCLIVGISFSLMGYFNGLGRTGFVALQGILSTFLLRIPVAYVMSRIPGVTLFMIGFATPVASVFAILLNFGYYFYLKNKEKSGVSLVETA